MPRIELIFSSAIQQQEAVLFRRPLLILRHDILYHGALRFLGHICNYRLLCSNRNIVELTHAVHILQIINVLVRHILRKELHQSFQLNPIIVFVFLLR